MTKDEAWLIIAENRGLNLQYHPGGLRPEEQAVLVARKRAWAKAWEVVGELVPAPPAPGGSGK